MKRILAASLATAVAMAAAAPVAAERPSCNWGELTASAISAGFPQGEHASQQVSPRAGLANVVERGNLEATCVLIRGLLP